MDELERRLTAWRAEADAIPDRAKRALVFHEIGCARELAGDLAGALAAWDEARKHDPAFRPAVEAAIRVRERSGDPAGRKALADLLAAEAKSAKDPEIVASALVDEAAVLEDFLGRGRETHAILKRALAAQPSSLAAALMLELHLRRTGQVDAALHASAGRAPHVKDPVLRRLLFAEAALARESDGEIDEAIAFLRTVTKEPIERWRLLRTLEAIARRHGREDALREVLETMGGLAEKRARGESIGQGLTAGSLPPFTDEAHARTMGTACFYELMRMCARAGLGTDAVAACDRALALRPNDPVLLAARLELAERSGDFEGALARGRALAEKLAGPHAAAVLLHVADLARAAGDADAEAHALEAAATKAPRSPAIAGIVQDRLLRTLAPSERAGWLERRAAQRDGGPPNALFQAAMIAADEQHDARRAQTNFARALDRADDPEPVLREMLGAGLRLGADEMAIGAARALVDVTVDARERAHLLFVLYHKSRDERVGQALGDPSTGPWAADVARVEAAFRKDYTLLAEAHRALATRADDDSTAAAHLCGAARALTRAGRAGEALDPLDEARARVPAHPYALALLEDVLRARGEEAKVAALLEEAAGDATAARDAEPLLLRAAQIAEAGGDAAHAAELLRAAIARSPKSVAPVERLAHLALVQKDAALEREALEILASRELEGGKPGAAQLRLATRLLLDRNDSARALEALRACFSDDEVGPFAATQLLFSPDHEAHEIEALERLLRDARGLGAAGLRRRLGVVLTAAGRTRDAEALGPRIREVRRDDRWVAWLEVSRAGTGPEHATQRADALERLAGTTTDDALAADLLIEARVLHAIAAGPDAAAAEARLTRAIADRDGGGLAALARDEVWLSDVPEETRVANLQARLSHASSELRPQLLAVLGRAYVAAGRHAEAVPALREALAKEHDDLASWEALAFAAREANAWTELVQACDRLAELASGAPRARLLEEAAIALLDHLGRQTDGEARLRDALGHDPSSTVAYRRLHGILEGRGDTASLLAIVSDRIAVIRDPAERVSLLDEQARLRHAGGDLSGAVDSLKQLSALDPGNAGALALMAATCARLERWPDAVDALRSLSCVDVPADERRMARLAASRFARERLGDVESALADLRVIDGMGLADEALYVHIADLAESAGKHRDAADALMRAAKLTADRHDKARYERRAAELFVDPLLDAEAAADAYLRALEAGPTDLATAEGLAALLDADQRTEVAEAFQDAVRQRFATHPTEASSIRKLVRSATWCGQRDLEMRALDVLVATGQSSDTERARWDELRGQAPATTTGSLDPIALGGEPLLPALRGVVAAADEAIASMDGIDPGALGAGRRSLVKAKEESDTRDAIAVLAGAVGCGCERFFSVPEGRVHIEAVPPADAPAWVVSDAVVAPLSATSRFRVASVAAAVAAGTSCLLRRPLDDAEALLHAIAIAGDSNLGEPPADAAALVAPVKKALSRKARKAIADAARYAAPEAEPARAFVHAARTAAWRAGLVAGGELAAVYDQLPHDARADLVRFWLSAEADDARRALGTALPDAVVSDVDTSEATAERAPVPVAHAETAEALLGAVVQAHPHVAKQKGGVLLLAEADASAADRVSLLRQLAAQRSGKVGARVSLAAAELLAAIGDTAGAAENVTHALAEDPNALTAIRRVRALRAREGAWPEVVALLEREAAMPVTPAERAFLLTLASHVSMHALADAEAAENAAKRAFMIRPQSGAIAAWLAEMQRSTGHAQDATQTIERAASVTSDGAVGAVWLVIAAREAELAGDGARARRFYRQALRLDGDALDAAIGLARRAWAEGDSREAAQAAQAASMLVTDTLLREAFLVAAARILHWLGGQPAEAVRALAGTEHAISAFARVDAARAQRDKRVLADALRAAAEASRRTERAIAWVELAEVRSAQGDTKGALEALREAGHADQTLTTLRVLREELARRTGDPLELARATRGAGHGALAASARAASVVSALDAERALLREAGRSDPTAAVIALDAAAEAGDRRAASQLMEAQPSGVGASLALADLLIGEDRRDDAVACLRAAHAASPDHPVVRRWLATLLPPAEGAALWLAEAEATDGASAGFAAGMASRLFLAADDRAEAENALRRALELAPGHPPNVWALESIAHESSDLAALRASMAKRAEESTDPLAAAEVLVRSAFLGDALDPQLLARAHDLVPDDPILADLRLRGGGELPAEERVELLARQANGASPEWARALRLRGALLCEEVARFGGAADHARAAREVAGADAFIDAVLDRVEPAAGQIDEAAERLLGDVGDAADDVSRALAFERYAELEAFGRGDLEAAANPLYGLLEQYPAHAASLRLLERITMTTDDDVRLKEAEERFASLGNPEDARAHARLAARVARRLPGAGPDAADSILRSAFDYVQVDAWLLRQMEGIARATDDARLLVQVLEEQAERAAGTARLVAELRLAEAIAGTRSPTSAASAANRLARSAEDADHPLAAELVARTYEAAGDHARAAEQYETAAAAAKSDARAGMLRYAAGRLWDERVGDLRRATDAFVEVARSDIGYADVFDRLQRLLPSVGESARLADLVERALGTVRGDRARLVELHLLLAQLNEELGDPKAAKKSLRTVATMEPKRSDVLEWLARVCQAEEDWRGAIDALQRVTRATEEPGALYPVLIELGDLYQRTRNVPRAEAVYKQALDLFPDRTAAQQRLEAIRPSRR